MVQLLFCSMARNKMDISSCNTTEASILLTLNIIINTLFKCYNKNVTPISLHLVWHADYNDIYYTV